MTTDVLYGAIADLTHHFVDVVFKRNNQTLAKQYPAQSSISATRLGHSGPCWYAASALSANWWANACSITSRWLSVASPAHSRKVERKPCWELSHYGPFVSIQPITTYQKAFQREGRGIHDCYLSIVVNLLTEEQQHQTEDSVLFTTERYLCKLF